MEKENIWFKAKKYGWGWTPANWKGWAVTVLFVVLVVWSVNDIDVMESAKAVLYAALRVFAWTALFVYIAYKKGEEPRWRWGKDDKSE